MLSEVIGNIGRSQVPPVHHGAHAVRIHGPGAHHTGHDGQALGKGLRRVERSLFVFLHVLVVRKGKPLARHQELHEVAHHATCLAANELGKIRVLLLRHNRGAG